MCSAGSRSTRTDMAVAVVAAAAAATAEATPEQSATALATDSGGRRGPHAGSKHNAAIKPQRATEKNMFGRDTAGAPPRDRCAKCTAQARHCQPLPMTTSSTLWSRSKLMCSIDGMRAINGSVGSGAAAAAQAYEKSATGLPKSQGVDETAPVVSEVLQPQLVDEQTDEEAQMLSAKA